MIELGYPRRGLHGHVVDELGRRVVGGRWAPGAPLPNEDDLVAELGVSRTVVRESIKVLQAKGLVEVRPKTGTRVRPRRAWHLLDPDVVGWLFADLERGDDLRRSTRAARGAGDDRGGGGAAGRRAPHGRANWPRSRPTSDASRRHGPSRWPERAADLDFHGAVVEAAHNSLLSHVSALIRVALEATDAASNGDRRERSPGRGVAGAGRPGDPRR